MRLSQKKPSFAKKLKPLLFTAIFASFSTTYLEMVFVGVGQYSFPTRPFPNVFPIHIGFTLLAIPLITVTFLLLFEKMNRIYQLTMLIMLGILAVLAELIAKQLGLISFSDDWQHLYSFFVYILFFMIN